MAPVAYGVPPLADAHHLGVLPLLLQLALNVTVPGPHLSPGVTDGVAGISFTVATTDTLALSHSPVAL